MIEKKKHEASEIKNEKVAYKYHALSTTLAKCLENSGFESMHSAKEMGHDPFT